MSVPLSTSIVSLCFVVAAIGLSPLMLLSSATFGSFTHPLALAGTGMFLALSWYFSQAAARMAAATIRRESDIRASR